MRESEPEKRRKPLIYIRLTNVQEHLYPHKGAFFQGSFFVARPAQKRGKHTVYHHFAKEFDRFLEPKTKKPPEDIGAARIVRTAPLFIHKLRHFIPTDDLSSR